ncbi:MAG TPA: AAA family ATPase [Cellvibrio sp.]|nr:AAA family ATPase [Cellvibrio sp.]
MPFINERIAQNEQQLERANYQKKPARPSRFRFDPQTVMANLSTRIVGQPYLLQAMEDMLVTLKADFNAEHRPLSVNLFLGPTGVGKTETVRVLAEALLGSADKICRIDMNTLAQEHYTAALTGSPPGYVGSKEGQTLFNNDHIKGSFSEPGIVLFDEIEKANKDVVRAMMNILDTGKLTLTSGARQLDFSNSLIFMTSNIGAREINDYNADNRRSWRRWLGAKRLAPDDIVDAALTRHFDPEFLNRIDSIIRFNPLDKDFLNDLINIELEKLNKRLSRRNASLILTKSARIYLAQEHDARYGARSLARRIRAELEPNLARALINYPEDHCFLAGVRYKNIYVEPMIP